jgi:hypothetical protein
MSPENERRLIDLVLFIVLALFVAALIYGG